MEYGTIKMLEVRQNGLLKDIEFYKENIKKTLKNGDIIQYNCEKRLLEKRCEVLNYYTQAINILKKIKSPFLSENEIEEIRQNVMWLGEVPPITNV